MGNGQLQVLYDFNTQNSLVEKTKTLDDNSRERNTYSVLFRSSYAWNERWSLTALFSWIKQEEKIKNPVGGTNTTSAAGIGDIMALAQYKLVSKPRSNLILAGGAKAPVGSTGRINEKTGLALNPDLQPGTGAWDGLVGVHYLSSGVFRPTSVLSASSIYRLTFSGDRYEGRQAYEFGDELQVLLGLSDSYLNQWLNPSLTLRYRHTRPDKADDIQRINTGGHWLHLMPEIRLNFSQKISGVFSGEIPLYRNLNGFQLTTTHRINFGLNYSFTS